MKFHAPEYYDDDLNTDHDGEEHRKKIAWNDCPSQLTDERTELLELQWRDGYPVEQPVVLDDHRSAMKSSCGDGDGDVGNACSPWEEKKQQQKKAVGQKETSTARETAVVEDWWKLWREGEGGGTAAAAAHGFPQLVDASLSSVNAKAATAGRPREMDETVAHVSDEELWRMWREGHGSSAPQNSVVKGDETLLPSSAASGGSSGAQRHSSEQTDQQCSTLDHAIEYLKSLQQQIQVLSSGGYGVQPMLFPCICGQPPHPAVPAASAAPLYPALAPAAAGAAPAPLYPASPPPHPAAADLNPVMVAAGVEGPPDGESGSLVGISAGSAEEMARRTSEVPFGGCALCSVRRCSG